MQHTFYKYQGTGNDFVLIDNRLQHVSKNDTKLINHFCDRRFGVGGDGLILLENAENSNKADFKMIYFNADGNQSTMCGNGGRCITAFAKFLGIIESETTFEAIDGLHVAKIENDLIHLKMIDVAEIEKYDDYTFLNTGSPHHVKIVNSVEKIDVKSEGAEIRYSNLYKEKGGSNINFVEQINNDTFKIRTYERGVEDETLSCGTGATAVAIAMFENGLTTAKTINIKVLGGHVVVKFNTDSSVYINVNLIGPAKQVFKGEINWE